MSTESIELLKQLIAYPSITPDDANCQDFIADYLRELGFTVESVPSNKVSNLWAWIGDSAPEFVYAGHTDVVPTGPLDQWDSDPFTATIKGDTLYGRGAADMKSSIAAMLVATKQHITAVGDRARMGFLITSGEEGDDYLDGTPKLMQHLQQQQQLPRYCVVGEPSSQDRLGDTLRIGRRGSLNATLIVHGKQGHVAYHHLADNPIHKAATLLHQLITHPWDQGNDYFPPTSLQISNVQAGTGASNVIPGELHARFNFRFTPETSSAQIRETVESYLKQQGLHYTLDWTLSGEPFLTQPDTFVKTIQQHIQTITGVEAELSTGGGTSDARFIAPYGVEVVELGVTNATIHQINECVQLDEVNQLSAIYFAILSSFA